jgi:uncharacterized protein YjbJ (UPF0337 family)
MNQDIIQGRWRQIAGQLQTQWGKLTDADLDVAQGHHDYLVGRLQERYGWQKEQAEREVRRFERRL